MYRAIKSKINYQPGIVGAVLSASKSPEVAFGRLSAKWGHAGDSDAKAIASLKRENMLSKGRFLSHQYSDASNKLTLAQRQLLNFVGRSTDPGVQSTVQTFLKNPGDPLEYEALIETVFGYDIEFGQNFTNPADQFRQLDRLADSNLLIVYYLNSIGLQGRSAFQEYFATMPNEQSLYGQVKVWLGRDDKNQNDPTQGNTPLPGSSPIEEQNNIYLP